MHGLFEVVYDLILCDHFWCNMSSVGNIFLQVVAISCDMPAFTLFLLGSKVIPSDRYHAMRQELYLTKKYEYLGSLHLTKAIRTSRHE
jgi:hypothetical protein